MNNSKKIIGEELKGKISLRKMDIEENVKSFIVNKIQNSVEKQL